MKDQAPPGAIWYNGAEQKTYIDLVERTIICYTFRCEPMKPRGDTDARAYIVTGRLTDARTVTLDEALPIESAEVRLVVEPLSPTRPRPYRAVIADIRQRQQARGHQPPLPEAIHAYLQSERESWEK